MTTHENVSDMQAMASLFRKKVKVIKALAGGLEKGGKNDFHKYKYITASDVKHAVGDAIADAGLSMQMSAIESRHINVPTKNGDALILQVQFQITLCDIDTGAIETSLWLGEAGLTGQDDKAANKAATAALKYYFLSNFLIGDKEEDERDADSDRDRNPDSQSRPTPKPAAPTPANSASHWSEDKTMMDKMYAWALKDYKYTKELVDQAIAKSGKKLSLLSRDEVKAIVLEDSQRIPF
jgi:hypothetical protein